MRNAAPVEAARGDAIMLRLSSIRQRVDEIDAERAALMAERLALFEEGQALVPKLTQAEMGVASGVTDAAVTLALKAARSRRGD